MRIGIDFGGTNIKFGLFAEDGTAQKFASVRVAELAASGNLLCAFLEQAAGFAAGETLRSGGLAMKGVVDRNKGTLINDMGIANIFAGVNVRRLFSERLGIPFSLENDARAYAVGEWKFGAGKAFDSVIVMTLGTGVGCGVILDGQLLVSASPTTGLLGGHISIDRNGPECSCGLRGCLELYCSAARFENQVLATFPELGPVPVPLQRFFAEAAVNPAYGRMLQTFQENLSIGIVNVMNAYGVNNLILGGGLMKSHRIILPRLVELVTRRAWLIPETRVCIVPAALGDQAACIGAAFLDQQDTRKCNDH